jgi:hypothetical protein
LPNTNAVISAYKGLMKAYVGLEAPSSPNDRLFKCPSDEFSVDALTNERISGSLHESAAWDFSSYGFNGLNRMSPAFPGVAGKKLSAIHDPAKVVLLAEVSAFFGFSWHDPANPPIVQDARSVISFADGHTDYVRIYWNGFLGKTDSPMFYNPTNEYDYKWSEN